MGSTLTRAEGASSGRRRTSLRCAVVALLAALLPLLLGSSAAQATGVTPAQIGQDFLDFMTAHPEVDWLAGSAGAGGTAVTADVAAGAAAASNPVVDATGLLLGSVYVGYELNKHVLHWTFGAGGDARTVVVTQIGNSDYGFVVDQYTSAPPSPAIAQNGVWWALRNNGAALHHVTLTYRCNHDVDGTLGPVHTAYTGLTLGPGQVDGVNRTGVVMSCSYGGADAQAGTLGQVTYGDELGRRLFSWTYDPYPAQPWTTVPHTRCLDATTGAYSQTVDGAPLAPIAAGPNSAGTVIAPDCPTGTSPSVEYLTGGRPGDAPTGVLLAVPVTRDNGVAASQQPSPQPSTQPSAQPSAQPSGAPGTGTVTSGDNPADDPTGDASAPEGSGRNCLGAAWSWNPVNWVLVPVKCALSWAFVPSDAAVAAAQARVEGAWTGNGLGAWAGSVTGAVTALGGIAAGADGCSGHVWTLDFPHLSPVHFAPFDACDEPMHTAAVVVHLFLSIACVLYGVKVCRRPIMAALGMGGA